MTKMTINIQQGKRKKATEPKPRYVTSKRYTREPGEMRKQGANQGFSELRRNRREMIVWKEKKVKETEHISVAQESRSHRSEQNGCTKSKWGLRPDALLLILQGGRRAQSSVGTKKSWLVFETDTQARRSRRGRPLGPRPPHIKLGFVLVCPRTSNLPISLPRSCLLGNMTKLEAFLSSSSPFLFASRSSQASSPGIC